MSSYREGQRKRNRWGNQSDDQANSSTHTTTSISDNQAMQALLASAEESKASAKTSHGHKRGRYQSENRNYRDGGGNGNNNSRRYDDQRNNRPQQHNSRQSRRNDDKLDKYSWGNEEEKNNQKSDTHSNNTSDKREPTSDGGDPNDEDTEPKKKQNANFALSGALAKDTQTGNVYNGVLLKFSEPPEARTPNTRWRLYVFKKGNGNGEDDLINTLHISRQSAYLFGREEKVADIRVDHPSLSKQHCVLQYRAVPDKKKDNKVLCRPYLMDLGSTNGTFINGVRLEEARYYELRKGDVIKLGASTREYVLLTENATQTGTGLA